MYTYIIYICIGIPLVRNLRRASEARRPGNANNNSKHKNNNNANSNNNNNNNSNSIGNLQALEALAKRVEEGLFVAICTLMCFVSPFFFHYSFLSCGVVRLLCCHLVFLPFLGPFSSVFPRGLEEGCGRADTGCCMARRRCRA